MELADLLPQDPASYDKMRPPKKDNLPTTVYFHFTITGIDSIDEYSMVSLQNSQQNKYSTPLSTPTLPVHFFSSTSDMIDSHFFISTVKSDVHDRHLPGTVVDGSPTAVARKYDDDISVTIDCEDLLYFYLGFHRTPFFFPYCIVQTAGGGLAELHLAAGLVLQERQTGHVPDDDDTQSLFAALSRQHDPLHGQVRS